MRSERGGGREEGGRTLSLVLGESGGVEALVAVLAAEARLVPVAAGASGTLCEVDLLRAAGEASAIAEVEEGAESGVRHGTHRGQLGAAPNIVCVEQGNECTDR